MKRIMLFIFRNPGNPADCWETYSLISGSEENSYCGFVAMFNVIPIVP